MNIRQYHVLLWHISHESVWSIQWLSQQIPFIHISRAHPRAQEFTKYMGLPSPLQGEESARAICLLKRLVPLYRWGMVPVSPARTVGSFPRMEEMGMTYRISFPGSCSQIKREPHLVIQDSVIHIELAIFCNCLVESMWMWFNIAWYVRIWSNMVKYY